MRSLGCKHIWLSVESVALLACCSHLQSMVSNDGCTHVCISVHFVCDDAQAHAVLAIDLFRSGSL